MKLILGILMFYGRFGLSFSNIGYAWRKGSWSETSNELVGRRVVITGGSGGIGAAVAADCIAAGAEVTVVARNPKKLKQLQDELGGALKTIQCDLAETSEVITLAETLAKAGPIDVLVNNVGVMLHEFSTNSSDMDAQYATNLLNQYVLTEALIGNSGLAEDASVIQVASGGMYMAPLVVAKLSASDAASHDGTQAYAIQKRAQVVLTEHWNASDHTGKRSFYVMHPGWVDTAGVQQSLPTFRKILKSVLRDSTAGADTIVWIAKTRPATTEPVKIWFDRAERAVHAYGFTKTPVTTSEALLEKLEADQKDASRSR
ncbi:MAG: SDR family NAD(P)-dependent oxidoreductase [Pseudomonadota bacterium]